MAFLPALLRPGEHKQVGTVCVPALGTRCELMVRCGTGSAAGVLPTGCHTRGEPEACARSLSVRTPMFLVSPLPYLNGSISSSLKRDD